MTDSARKAAPQTDAEAPAEEPVAERAAEPAVETETKPDGKADAKPDGKADAKPDIDEVKRKFREALNVKRQAHSDGNAKGGQDTGRIHGTHGPAGGKRSFRRKSG